MKSISQTIIGLLTITWLGTGMAIPITANSGTSFYHDMVIASGGQLPIGLDSVDTPPNFTRFTNSELQAPDTVNFENTDTVIAGLSPENPSVFSQFNSSTRNAGAEGAIAADNTQLYQIRELEIVPDGNNDVSERGVWGNGQAQASLSTEIYDTRAVAGMTIERGFTFSNNNPFAMTFGIEGLFEMDLFATADGENSFAEAFARIDMFFSSSNILDIVFADTSPYLNNQTESGDNASISLVRETDVVNTGYLSLMGSATASGAKGFQQAFGNSTMSYALGITLLPGEEITMSHLITYSNLAAIEAPIVDVNEPVSSILILFALGFSLIRKQYLY